MEPNAILARTQEANLWGAGLDLGRDFCPMRNGRWLSRGRPPECARWPDNAVLRRAMAVGCTGMREPRLCFAIPNEEL